MSVISWLFHRRPDYDPRRAQHQAIMDAQAQQGEWSNPEWHEGDGYHYYKPPEVGEYSVYDIKEWLAHNSPALSAEFRRQFEQGYFGQPKAEREAGELKDNQVEGKARDR